MAIGLDTVVYSLLKKYTDNSIRGITGALAGKNCTVESASKHDGLTTVVFKWTADDGTVRRTQIEVEDGTPIYTWTSGNHYEYGDLVIYASMFYRCITDNSDVEFDDTKWNELGSPDGNYDIVQHVADLPTRFTSADRKLYYVIEENDFYLWNGTAWVRVMSNSLEELEDVDLDNPAEGEVLTWDNTAEKWVNKKGLLQYSTMPIAAASLEGRVVQYVGETTDEYINGECYKEGGIYKCVANGTSPETYKWEMLSITSYITPEIEQIPVKKIDDIFRTRKTLISIVDDDGKNSPEDSWTGLRSFLNNRNIPMTLAVPTDSPGKTATHYTLAELHRLVDEGNEVVMHGTGDQNSGEMTLYEFKEMIDASRAWAKNNGFTDDVFVYPRGLQPTNTSFDDKLAYLDSKGIRAAFSVSTTVENALTTGYEDWYNYTNGHDCRGMYNKVPFATMPNGVSKKFLLNRFSTRPSDTRAAWYRTILNTAINNGGYICFYMHSYTDEMNVVGTDGKTGIQLFEETIEYILENFSDKVDFVTLSDAYRRINDDGEYLDSEGLDYFDEHYFKPELNKKLEKASVLPTASAEEEGNTYILTSPQTGYKEGGVYKCVAKGTSPETYEWRMLSSTSYVTPQQFGAKADGITDDTDAVRQALNQGGVVYFPAGTYKVKSNIAVNVPSNGLRIFGDGKHQSIIKPDYKTIETEWDKHFIRFIGDDENVESTKELVIEDIGIVYDKNDSSELTFSTDSYMMLVLKRFKSVSIKDCYLHSGGSGSNLPKMALIWFKGGADTISVDNTVFENFTNNRNGGCVWATPYNDLEETQAYSIGTVEFCNNVILNTNCDESLSIWNSGNSNSDSIKNVLIHDNYLCHDDFNGPSYKSDNVLTVGNITYSSPQGVIVDWNILIADNTIDIYNSGQYPIKVLASSNAKILDNVMTIYSANNEAAELAPIYCYYGTYEISGNLIDNKTSLSLRIYQNNSDVLFNNNTVLSDDIRLAQSILANTFTITNNTFKTASNKRVMVTGAASNDNKTIIHNNVFNTYLDLLSISQYEEVTDNKCAMKYSGEPILPFWQAAGGELVFINNIGLGITLYDTNDGSLIKLSKFKYVGERKLLRFAASGEGFLPDNATTRARFATSMDTQYYVDSDSFGTAAVKNVTMNISPGNHDLPDSNAVYSAIDAAVSSVYEPRGPITCAGLTSELLIEANVGNVYNVTDSGTTTALFKQGAGHAININDSVSIVRDGATTYKFNLMGNTIDLHNYQTKDLTTPVESATTVEGALGALSSNKVDKVTGKGLSTYDYDATEKGKVDNSIQKSNTAGHLMNDGTVDTTAYAKKNSMSITDGTGADADKVTIQLKEGTSTTVLKTHQDLSSYQTKNLTTPLTIGGVSKTNVEDALEALNDVKATQFATMPTASADYVGTIVQYVGATTSTYTQGYWYKCVSDGEVTPTYSWQQVNTQPPAETPTAATTTYDNTSSGKTADDVQDAIDDIYTTTDLLVSDVSTLDSAVDAIEAVIPSGASSSNKLVDAASIGTAAGKGFTTNVAPGNHDLVESNAVYSAINNAVSSVYTPRGEIACADLTSSLLVAANVGNVYNTSDSGTTTALFMQGAGKTINTGDSVGIIQNGPNSYIFNLMGSTIDLHEYQKKVLTTAVEGASTVEGALGALSTNKQSKTLATTLKIGGINRTSVEDSLGALNNWKVSTVSKRISFGETSGDVYAFLDKCVEIGILKKNTQMSFELTQIYDHTVLWTFTDLNNFNANRCTIKFNGYYSVNSSNNTTNTFSIEIISWVNHVIYYYFEDRPNYGGPHSWRTVSTNPYYSTSEVFTGQYWIDGKPIYRKTYTGLSLQSPSTNVWNSFSVTPPADAGLLIKSMIIRNDKVACEGIALKLDTIGNDILYINPTFNASTNNVTLTIEYTKTTD